MNNSNFVVTELMVLEGNRDWEQWKENWPLTSPGYLRDGDDKHEITLPSTKADQQQYVRLFAYIHDLLDELACKSGDAAIDFNNAIAENDEEAADAIEAENDENIKYYAAMIEALIVSLDDEEIRAIRSVSKEIKARTKREPIRN